jgi:sugar fermentation stimulation protein A
VDLTEKFPTKGIYTLIVFLSNDTQLKVGKLGTQTFPAGYYTYTGSALGRGASSLKQRVTRHLNKRKQQFWHIDFLLAHENATITTIIAVQTSRKLECKMNHCLIEELKTKIPVIGFGASDCKENCKSHLLFFSDMVKEKMLIKKIVNCARLMNDHVFVINAH